MPSHFSAVEQDAIQRALRPMGAADLDPVALFDSILDGIDGLTAGSTAMGTDIDSLALGGGSFTPDPDTTTGLTWGYQAGRIFNGFSEIVVAAGTIGLSASTTNYIEVDNAGVVHTNTASFTPGRLPLWTVVTGTSTITMPGAMTSYKPFLSIIGPRGVNGAMLTVAGATKEIDCQLGTISATTSFAINSPAVAATVSRIILSNSTAFAGSDTDYWTFSVVNQGPLGTGTTAVLNTGPVNTTKATGGTPIVANVALALMLNATTANLNTAANDVLLVSFTKTGAPANLTIGSLRVDYSFTA